MSPPIDCVPLLEHHGLYEMAEWASERPIRHGWKGRTCRDLWAAAPRGDWLLHYAWKAGADPRDLVRAAAACVRPALRFIPAGEDRPRLAVEAAQRWADAPTEANRRRARRAAKEAWEVEAASAAWDVLSAADAARAAAAAAAGAASMAAVEEVLWARASASAARAHYHADGPESEAAAHRACADEVRRLVPFLDLGDVRRRR